jgi:hypothetical protein
VYLVQSPAEAGFPLCYNKLCHYNLRFFSEFLICVAQLVKGALQNEASHLTVYRSGVGAPRSNKEKDAGLEPASKEKASHLLQPLSG